MKATLDVTVLQHCPDLSQVEIKAPGLTQRLWVPTGALTIKPQLELAPVEQGEAA